MLRPKRLFAGLMLSCLILAPAHAGVIVVDGGTVMLDGAAMRLWGVEAPPAGQVCTTTAGTAWPCGDRARDQLAAVAADEEISCEQRGEGTVLCRAAGLDLGLLLVKEGLARAHGDYADAEAAARAARIGLWE